MWMSSAERPGRIASVDGGGGGGEEVGGGEEEGMRDGLGALEGCECWTLTGVSESESGGGERRWRFAGRAEDEMEEAGALLLGALLVEGPSLSQGRVRAITWTLDRECFVVGRDG